MRWALTALICLPTTAWGHAGDLLDSLDILPPTGDQVVLAIESTIGLMLKEDGNPYQWLCHEAITKKDSVMTPRYIRSPTGFILGTVPKDGEGREPNETVYRTTDYCDWQQVSGLTGQVVVDFSLDPTEPDTVYVVTNTTDGSTNNGVWVSTDGGVNWTPTNLQTPDREFRSIVVTKGEIWATTVQFDSQNGWLHRSKDNGATWTEWPLNLKEYPSPPDILLLETHDSGVWFRVTQTLKDELWSLSDDTAQMVYAADTKIMTATQYKGTLYMALWNDGIAKLEGNSISLVPDSPISYAIRSQNDKLYAATRPLTESNGMMTSTDGAAFEEAFTYADLGPPPICGETSHSAIHCDPLWPDLQKRLEPPVPDTGDTGETKETGTAPPTEKGCKNKNPKNAWLLFGLLPLLARRFHRP